VQEKVAAARRRRVLVAGAVAALVAVSAVVLAVRATGDDDATDEPKSDALLLLADYSISGTLAVGAGDVKFAVANNGNTAHNVGIRGGPITANLAPGQGGLLQIQDLQPGTYELYCDIADHEERGMTTILVVVDVAASSSVTSVG
jgi:plastocyanin